MEQLQNKLVPVITNTIAAIKMFPHQTIIFHCLEVNKEKSQLVM